MHIFHFFSRCKHVYGIENWVVINLNEEKFIQNKFEKLKKNDKYL